MRKIFPALLAASLIVELVANATVYVTYVNITYRFVVLFAAVMLCPLTHSFLTSLSKRITLPLAYVVIFVVVSYFGVNFEYSVKYHVLLLPVHLIDFTLWYMAGYFFHEKVYLRFFGVAAVLFGVGSLIFASMGIIDPEQSRVIYGLDLPIAMPITVMFGNVLLGGIILFVSFLSLKKTTLACSSAGLLFAYFAKKITKTPGWSAMRRGRFARVDRIAVAGGKAAVLIVGCVVLAYEFSPYLYAMVDRLSNSSPDVIRLAAASEFVTLLQEYFPFGTGYYTFGYLTQGSIYYPTYTADGILLNDGISLHNTFMHFALEGGLPILVVITLLYWSFAKVLRRLYKFEGTRSLAIVLIAWAVVSIMFAMFQQFHGTRYFFGIIGYAFGAFDRYELIARRNATPFA